MDDLDRREHTREVCEEAASAQQALLAFEYGVLRDRSLTGVAKVTQNPYQILRDRGRLSGRDRGKASKEEDGSQNKEHRGKKEGKKDPKQLLDRLGG